MKLLCFLILIIPIIIKFAFLNNISNDAFAGYIGGCIGGGATLLAVMKSVMETRRIERENKKLELYRARKQFTDEIVNDMSRYISDISMYFYNCKIIFDLNAIKENRLNALSNIDKNIRAYYILQKDENKYINFPYNREMRNEILYELNAIEKNLDNHKPNRIIANKCYFAIKMKLSDIKSAKALLNILEEFHDEVLHSEDKEFDWLEKRSKNLQRETKKFIKNYLDSSL